MLVKLLMNSFTRFEKIGRTWEDVHGQSFIKSTWIVDSLSFTFLWRKTCSDGTNIESRSYWISLWRWWLWLSKSKLSLKELIDTRFAVFDVLPNFFYHKDNWIGLAALEVYARRAYRAYQLMDVEYYTDKVPFMFSWNFYFKSINSPTISFAKSSTFSMRR